MLAVALAAWFCFYAENLPMAREPTEQDVALEVKKGRSIRLGGLAAGKVMTIRSVGAKRVLLTIPAQSKMLAPDRDAFLAKAKLDAPTLGAIQYGKQYIVLDGAPAEGENLSLDFAIGDDAQSLILTRNLKQERGWSIVSDNQPILIDANLNATTDAAQGTLILSRPEASAMLGSARFELPPGAPLVVEFKGAGVADNQPAAIVEFAGGQLAVRSITTGSRPAEGRFQVNRIACAAGEKRYLWKKIVPGVDPSDCRGDPLLLNKLDLGTGMVDFEVTSAFFEGFSPKDSARFVSRALANPVIGPLVTTAISVGLIGWAVAQFRRRRKAPARSRTKRPRTKSSEKSL